jgi:acetyl-CoA carboxylase beta subunit
MVDMVVDRHEIPDTLANLLKIMTKSNIAAPEKKQVTVVDAVSA